MRLSVLDLVPVRTDQSTSDALAATTRLARTADRLGFERFWLAEHHNIASIAATNPAVLIALIAGQTARIRVGSGGVMLPNHAPLAVVEQFALLEAAYPGRVDLGVGRAPGSDPVTSAVLRGPTGRDDREVEQFPHRLDDVVALLNTGGTFVQLPDGRYPVKATPAAATEPRLWLLGSSEYSAALAAAKGLPYVFGHHLFGEEPAQALARYRAGFVPGRFAAAPVAILTANVVVAETRAEATALALPHLQMMARLETGEPLGPLDLVEDAQAAPLTPQQQQFVETGLRHMVLGTAAEAVEQLRALADRSGVDEVMVSPVASARRGTGPATAPARETTLELLAAALG